MKKKYAITLLEIIIVIFIIGIISSVVGYNLKDSLDQGKVFKTKQGMQKIYEIVQLEDSLVEEMLNGKTYSENIATILKRSGFVKNIKNLMKDGWGNEYIFELVNKELRMSSEKYKAHCEKKNTSPEYPWD